MAFWHTKRDIADSPVTPFEALEGRTLLSVATGAITDMFSDATTLTVVVDWGNTDTSTLGNGDIQVSANSRTPIPGVVVGSPVIVNGKQRVAYRFTAYDNAWGSSDTGLYTITSPAGQIRSPQGDPLSSPTVGTRTLWFAVPKARLISTTVRPFDWLVVVQYDSLNGINQSTIDGTDLTDSGPNNGIVVSSIIPLSSTSIKVVYQINAQDGAWSYTANGITRLSIGAGKVQDASGRAVTAHTYQDFGLWFATPKAQVLSTIVGENDWIIPVRFSAISGSAINPATLVSDGAIVVTGPGGYSEMGHLAQLLHNPDGSYTAQYRVDAKGGSWDFRDNGQYTATMQANRVSDASGRFIPGYGLKTYGLWFTTPAAEVVTPLSPGSTSWTIGIRFRDDVQLDRSTINVNSIRVVGPDGLEHFLTLLSISGPNPGNTATATYRLLAPSGFLQGTYNIYLNRDGVRDSGGRLAAENLIGSYTFA